ncbi:hypothetical protein, partial [Frigidibacter sp. MR17.24]|uniref:hypothetical protein n=1 Tax=Frigidibacter sp. MR17.24 TaxID=3127345 RepID=UPI00301301ED
PSGRFFYLPVLEEECRLPPSGGSFDIFVFEKRHVAPPVAALLGDISVSILPLPRRFPDPGSRSEAFFSSSGAGRPTTHLIAAARSAAKIRIILCL